MTGLKFFKYRLTTDEDRIRMLVLDVNIASDIGSQPTDSGWSLNPNPPLTAGFSFGAHDEQIPPDDGAISCRNRAPAAKRRCPDQDGPEARSVISECVMTEPSHPKYREHLYPQPSEDKPLTPDQAREALGWKLLPEAKDYGHDD